MAYGYAFSAKAAKKVNGKLAQLRGTKAQKSKMAGFESKEKDEVGTRGEVPNSEINHRTNQGGSATYGRQVSKGGAVNKTGQFKTNEINKPGNGKTWPAGGDVKASNPKTGNTRMKGPIAKEGGQYGGGGQNTQ